MHAVTHNKGGKGNRILGVGEVARRSGVPVSTIHFYESKGLIKSTRNAGNHRQYPAIVLRYIAIIRFAQSAGMSLNEIGETLSTFQAGDKLTVAQWNAISLRWKNNLDQRIQALVRLRDELNSCIGCGCLSLEDCPLRNPEDVLGEEGPGARILART